MGEVRTFRPDDIPSVACLHRRAFGAESTADPQRLEAYLDEIFFRNPWYDESVPSLVHAEGSDITGFLGVMPRPMEFRGERLQALVVAQMMADPDRAGPLVPPRLLRTLFKRPEDLVLTDGANGTAQNVWISGGGAALPLYDLHWQVILRPVRHLASRARRKGGGLRMAGTALLPLTPLADAGLRRFLPPVPSSMEPLREEPLTVTRILEEIPRLKRRFRVTPAYDAASLQWLFEQAELKKRHGPLHATALFGERGGGLHGWYIVYLARDDAAEVLQMYARPGREAGVLSHLLDHAFDEGCVLVRGRCDPAFIRSVDAARGTFLGRGPSSLCYSRRSELLAALRGGEAFFTRFEAEWWMRFLGE